MAAATFACPKCRTEFEASPTVDRQEFSCPTCAEELEAFFFPALFRPRETGAIAAALLEQSDTSCFYHPQKQAAQVCDGCGRLICSLCSIEMGNEHLCPNCLSSGRRKGTLDALQNNRTCYDKVALSLALLGIPFYVFAIFLAPAVLYITVRHWNSPGSVMGVSRTRFIVASILAVLELILCIAIAIFVVVHPVPHPTR
jgi:hypothetical protein